MPDQFEIAGVLEDAARLYRDEKVQWCAGTWISPGVNGVPYSTSEFSDVLANMPEDATLSMCAEGALMRAAGFSLVGVHELAMNSNREYVLSLEDDSETVRYVAARRALLAHLRDRPLNEYLLDVPAWNDHLGYEEVPRTDASRTVIRDSELAKASVIDAFEATAKELRNG